jgi:hypothetical protein
VGEGFARLPRRTDEERGATPRRPDVADRADVRRFALNLGRFGGLLALVPVIAKLGVDGLAGDAKLPGTKTIPAVNALLSALALKLASVERKSHVMDLGFDEGPAPFADLNVIPKARSSGSTRAGWVARPRCGCSRLG